MILCIGTTPAAQRVMVFRHLTLDAVNRAMTTLDGAAGKSINVAKVLHALDEAALAVTLLGGDRGNYLRSVLDQKGVALEAVTVAAQTRQCVTVIDEASGAHTELVEESQPVDPAAFDELLGIIRQRMAGCQAAVMSGTIAPGGPGDFYNRCARIARVSGAISIVDAQGPALLEALKAAPGLVKPNRAELAATVGRKLGEDTEVFEAMKELCERGAQRVVVTAGKGATLAFDGGNCWRIVPPRVPVMNPIGSGDAFTAGLVWRLVRGDDLGEACRWGSAAGTANALTLMAGEVNRSDVERLAKEVKVEPL